MRIILSPAKKMRVDDDLAPVGTPVYLPWAIQLLNYLKSLSYEELQKLWACSDKIAQENYDRLQNMKLDDARTPAFFPMMALHFSTWRRPFLRLLSFGMSRNIFAFCPASMVY